MYLTPMSGREERRHEAQAEALDDAVAQALADPEALAERVLARAPFGLLCDLDLVLTPGPCEVVDAPRLAAHFAAYGAGGLPPSVEARLLAWIADDCARREGWGG